MALEGAADARIDPPGRDIVVSSLPSRSAGAKGAPAVTGIEDITKAFDSQGFGVPPVPPRLGGALTRLDAWLWSTRDLDRGGLYDPHGLIDDATRPCPDYVAVGTSGHGVNSSFLTCGRWSGQSRCSLRTRGAAPTRTRPPR